MAGPSQAGPARALAATPCPPARATAPRPNGYGPRWRRPEEMLWKGWKSSGRRCLLNVALPSAHNLGGSPRTRGRPSSRPRDNQVTFKSARMTVFGLHSA